MSTSTVARDIARSLLEIEAIKLSPEKPFNWSSGWTSPIYCDNRITLSYPDLRSFIKRCLIQEINKRYQPMVIAGVATAGIPQGALVADSMGLPFIYVRSKPKGHGMENLIEGKAMPGEQVVVIEDLISTAGSSIKAINAIRDAGMEVVGLASIFNYGFTVASENLEKASVNFFSLSNYSTLLEEAVIANYINSDQMKSLQEWNKDPENWAP